MLGADVFNDNGAKLDEGDWPKAATDAGQNTLPERNIKLGDVFHSAPVVVDAPLPSDGVLCKNGLHSQCLTSLWKTPTAHLPANTNAYDAYSKDPLYRDRRKIILVGANDGLLHAIDGGTWVAGENDTLTDGIDESKPPFNGYYTRGTGKEVWAFLPPDLIAKIPLLATGHQLFVDGSPMVRDVWVDNTENRLTTSTANPDGKKQGREFHTVAVVGERRGGTHYFALDVTEATYMPTEAGFEKPKFLWLYPQTDDPESLDFGETYDDYLPSRPPIGPVRIAADSTSNALFGVSTPSGSMPTASGNVDYHERWVTFLAGGFDPQGLRGRGVHMVDVWTGKELFDFSRPTTGCASSDTDPRCKLNAPIAATVAMLMWGTSATANASFGNDGFFDTATFGDTGGQLWTLRFSAPGTLGSTSEKVTNWYGGRSFQVVGCSNQPFFYITANTQVTGGWLRTYAGTGDRYNLLDTYGGKCGPDNLRACAQRGCTVTVSSASDANTLACSGLGRETSGLALAACSSSKDAFFSSTSRASSPFVPTCDPATAMLEGKANVLIDCGGSGTNVKTTTKNRSYTCTDSADGLTCGYAINAPGALLDLDDANNIIQKHNWYFSVRVFDTARRPIFSDSQGAIDYDTARLTVTNSTTASTGITLIDGGVDAPTALATAASNGWAMYFNHDGTRTADDHDYSGLALRRARLLDERALRPAHLEHPPARNRGRPQLGQRVEVSAREVHGREPPRRLSLRRGSGHGGIGAEGRERQPHALHRLDDARARHGRPADGVRQPEGADPGGAHRREPRARRVERLGGRQQGPRPELRRGAHLEGHPRVPPFADAARGGGLQVDGARRARLRARRSRTSRGGSAASGR